MEEMNSEELERLSRAIINAIVKSEDVQKALALLYEEEPVCNEGLMVLMIRMRALTDAAEELRDVTRHLKNGDRKRQFIDGRELSPQEAAFQEYCAEKFDEEKWLKDIRVTFKN